MLIPSNEAVTVVSPIWIEHSNRNGGFTVACPAATSTLCIDYRPTILVKRLTVAVNSTSTGVLIIRKWFAGGTLFIDEVSALLPIGVNVVFSDTLLESCQIFYSPTVPFAAVVSITAIGRS